jgi:hypothetical protein
MQFRLLIGSPETHPCDNRHFSPPQRVLSFVPVQRGLIVNSELWPPRRKKKIVGLLQDQMPSALKHRMGAGIFVLIILAANIGLAVAAYAIVRLLGS